MSNITVSRNIAVLLEYMQDKSGSYTSAERAWLATIYDRVTYGHPLTENEIAQIAREGFGSDVHYAIIGMIRNAGYNCVEHMRPFQH